MLFSNRFLCHHILWKVSSFLQQSASISNDPDPPFVSWLAFSTISLSTTSKIIGCTVGISLPWTSPLNTQCGWAPSSDRSKEQFTFVLFIKSYMALLTLLFCISTLSFIDVEALSRFPLLVGNLDWIAFVSSNSFLNSPFNPTQIDARVHSRGLWDDFCRSSAGITCIAFAAEVLRRENTSMLRYISSCRQHK